MIINKPHIVVDLETLSTRSNACIISIGAVRIENLEIVDEFFVNVDPATCKDAGLHIDKHTVQWWTEQSKEAREAWQVNPLPLDEALDKFTQFYGFDSVPIWGYGSNFDVVILENAMTLSGWNENRNIGEKFPWKFWDINCLRTLSNVLDKRLPKKNNHNALDDATAQGNLLIEILKS